MAIKEPKKFPDVDSRMTNAQEQTALDILSRKGVNIDWTTGTIQAKKFVGDGTGLWNVGEGTGEGPKGLKGDQGIQGEPGNTGPEGPEGPKGSQGEKGKDVDTATLNRIQNEIDTNTNRSTQNEYDIAANANNIQTNKTDISANALAIQQEKVRNNTQDTELATLANKLDVLEDSSEFKAQYLEKEPEVLGSEPDTGCFYMLSDAETVADSYANATMLHMNKQDTLGIIHGIELLVVDQQLSIDEQDGSSFGRYMINALEDKGDSVVYDISFITGRGQATSGEVVSVKAFPEVDLDDKADIVYVDAQDALKADITYVDTQDNLKADITYVDAQDDKKLNLTGGDITGKVSLQSAALFVNGPNVGSANNFAVRDSNGSNSFLVQGTPGGVFIDGKKVATQEYVTNNSGAGLANSTATLYNATCGYRLGTTGLGVEEFYINNENASGITEIGFLNLYNYLGNRIPVSGYVLTRGGEVEIYRRDSNQVVYRGIVKSKRIAGTGGATSKDILVLGITSLLYTDHKFVNNGMQSYAVKVSGLQT